MSTKDKTHWSYLIREANGKPCSKRIVGFACFLVAAALAFVPAPPTEVILAFLGGALTANGLTIWDFKNKSE
jgi:hypothetical protein